MLSTKSIIPVCKAKGRADGRDPKLTHSRRRQRAMSSRIHLSLWAWATTLVNQTQGTQYLLKSDFRLLNFFLSSWDMKPAGIKWVGRGLILCL